MISSSKTTRRFHRRFLEIPFGHKRSRYSSPSPPSIPSPAFSNTLTNTLDTKSIATPIPTKSEAQKAIKEYIDTLSDDDQIAFQSATDVMQKLAELKQNKPCISNLHLQRVQKVLQCVKRFIAIYIQHSPRIYSLVVGGLHCVLTVGTLCTHLIFIITHVNMFLLDSLHWDILSFLRNLPK